MLDHIARLKESGRRRAAGCVQALLKGESVQGQAYASGHLFRRNETAVWHCAGVDRRSELIIVDEPRRVSIAERNRFYNLLSQLGQNTIVILSTHIVEDVSTLCSSFAIICKGEVLYAGDRKRR